MAHKPLVNGAVYEISGGKDLIGGTVYEKDHGKTLVGGTAYEVGFGGDMATVYLFGFAIASGAAYVEINGTRYNAQDVPQSYNGATGIAIEVPIGTEIVCHAQKATYNGYSVGGTGAIKVNGTDVAYGDYIYTVTGNVNIGLMVVTNVSYSSPMGTITITE